MVKRTPGVDGEIWSTPEAKWQRQSGRTARRSAIDGLKDALARLRKFGGRTIIGLQSIAQVSGTYGKAAADTIVENTGNTLILRCSASERGGTSEFASKLIGQREVLHTTQSTSRQPMEWLASTTESEHLKIEPAIMASEIERLPDLAGFLKLILLPPAREGVGAQAHADQVDNGGWSESDKID